MTLLFSLKSHLFALAITQTAALSGTLNGVVTDPTGAVVHHATVSVHGRGVHTTLQTDGAGRFTMQLPNGDYTVTISSPGFTLSTNRHLHIEAGQVEALAVHLKIDVATEEVAAVGAEAAGHGALTFTGDRLAAFADTDEAFQQQVLALAGADGIHAPTVLVNGFSGGRFPPKDTIREIRINEDPYSAQYDSLGIGRVEILTRPGGDSFHGQASAAGNEDPLNSRNPYAAGDPAYHSLFLNGNLGGPLGKSASFFANGKYNDAETVATVNAQGLDSALQPIAIAQSVNTPTTSKQAGFRADWQASPGNTATANYMFEKDTSRNSKVGLLVLPSQGLNLSTEMHTLQLSDTTMFGDHTVNEARFQYLRTRLRQTPLDTSAAIVVQGAFTGGGNNEQSAVDNQDAYEFQNYFSHETKSHFLRAGARYRITRDANESNANYNGMYVYPDLETYRNALLHRAGAGPSQYSVTTGQTGATVSSGDIGLYLDDTWKAAHDLTMTLGLRIESQSGIPDHFDPAPRFGVAWTAHQRGSKTPLFHLQAGGGIFYERFALRDLLTATRQNGVSQKTFYQDHTSSLPLAQDPTVYRVQPDFRSPSIFTLGITADRQIGKLGTITASYLWVRGWHQLLSRNINAPINGVRPLGGTGNQYRFSSDGELRQNVLFVNANLNATKRFTCFIYGVLEREYTNTRGADSFASNQYDLAVDYGRVSAPQYQFYSGGWVHLPHQFDVGSFLAVRGNARFDITIGSDINQDSQYNDRPAFATDTSRKSVMMTPYGALDTAPLPSEQRIPVNYGDAPNFVALQLQANKVFRLGAHAQGKKQPYALVFGINVMNALNHRNAGVPVGVLSSANFNRSISLAEAADGTGNANRVMNLRVSFSF